MPKSRSTGNARPGRSWHETTVESSIGVPMFKVLFGFRYKEFDKGSDLQSAIRLPIHRGCGFRCRSELR